MSVSRNKRPISSFNSDHLSLSTNPRDYDRDFPVFRRPVILGEFSLDSERKFHHDRHQMAYLYRRDGPHVNLDLNKGIQKVKRKVENETKKEQLDNLLKWILVNKSKFLIQGSKELLSLNSDFVCYRGLLTTIMCTPYEHREGWEVKVIKWKGTFYICQVETEQKIMQRLKETPRQKMMSSWGYKFEQYMSSSHPESLPDTNMAVNEAEEFCCVFRSRLDRFSLVYGAEMDGYDIREKVEQGEKLLPNKFVEMKTSRMIEHDRQRNNFFRFKVMKWWGQSFLVGIEEIVCGWRNDNGIVSDIQSFSVESLPKSAVDWRANVCVNFLNEFLTELNSNIREDGLKMEYSVAYQPNKGFSFKQAQVSEGETFLPEWYTQSVFCTKLAE